jgi:hypothetical protein
VIDIHQKGTTLQKILRRVSRDGQLGKYDEIGALAGSPSGIVDDLSGVSANVSYDRIDLRKCYSHVPLKAPNQLFSSGAGGISMMCAHGLPGFMIQGCPRGAFVGSPVDSAVA